MTRSDFTPSPQPSRVKIVSMLNIPAGEGGEPGRARPSSLAMTGLFILFHPYKVIGVLETILSFTAKQD